MTVAIAPSPARRLLIVEDDDAVREELGLALDIAGFAVVSVINGQEALERLERDAQTFDTLITDIDLGSGPGGWQVAERARLLNPGLRVIYMSGDSLRSGSDKAVPDSVKFMKPFQTKMMIQAINGFDGGTGLGRLRLDR